MAIVNLDFKVKHGLQVQGNATLSGASNDVGTITTGIWNGSVISPTKGGTGQNFSGASGYLLFSNGVATATPTIPSTAIVGSVAAASSVPFSGISNLPTTLIGYGITDAQPLDGDLTSIATLVGLTGHLQKNSANMWSLDTAVYITGNQTIAVTGDATGSGNTAINLTLSNTSVVPSTYTSVTVDSKGRVTSGTKPTTLSGYGITDSTPLTHTTDYTLHLTPAQNSWIDGITATQLEVNYISGTTSNIQTQLGTKASLSGASMTGNLIMSANTTITAPTPASGFVSSDAVNKAYVDALVTSGVVWESPISDPELSSDNVNGQPPMPVDSRVYIIGPTATGTFWSGKEGHAVYWNGTSWIDLLGRAVVVGDRFGVTLEAKYNLTGGLVGRADSIAQIATATPGAITYTFTSPVSGKAVFCNNASSIHFSHSYTYVNTGWIEISGPSSTPAGVGLYYAGNTLNVSLGAAIAQLPTNEVGVDVYSGGGLMTTVDGNTTSTTTGAQLSLTKAGTAGTYKSVVTDAYGRITSGSNPTTLSGYGIVDAQPLDADLTAIGALTGTPGTLTTNGAGAWTINTTSYSTTDSNVTLNNSASADAHYVTLASSATGNQQLLSNSGLLFTPSTGTLAAASFSGSGAELTNLNATNLASGTVPASRLGSGTGSTTTFLRGDNTWATVSTTDTKVNLTDSTTAGFLRVPFANSPTGTQELLTNSSFVYNPATGTLVATTFNGNATTALAVTLAGTAANTTQYITFTSQVGAPTGTAPLNIDYSSAPLSYNPGTGVLTTTTVVGNLTGTASTAAVANALNTSNAYNVFNLTSSSGIIAGNADGNGYAVRIKASTANVQGVLQWTDNTQTTAWTSLVGATGLLNCTTGLQSTSLGIGTAPSATTGEIRATNNITAYYSDARLKTVSGNITDALTKVCSLNGVIYTNNQLAGTFGYTTQEEQVGVLAQEVKSVMPQVVTPAPFDIGQRDDGTEFSKSGEDYMTVRYDRLVPLLIEAIKELKAEVELLKSIK